MYRQASLQKGEPGSHIKWRPALGRHMHVTFFCTNAVREEFHLRG